NYLEHTNHPGLSPVLWRLIESFPGEGAIDPFLPKLYATEDTGLANRRLIKLACDPNYPEVYAIFGYWRGEKFTLSAEEMALLLKSENVWIRALTCVTFPDQCGKEWTERLLRDLRESQQPMPDKLFARLLPNLDDDDFAVRQQATEELQRHGERVRT